MTHAHITAWFLTLVLFLIALNLNKSGNAKGVKILHMIIRVFYLLIILTGGLLLFSAYHISPFMYILKAIVGLWIISLFELILMKAKKKEKTSVLWIQFVIAFLLVLYLGLKLPLGFHIF